MYFKNFFLCLKKTYIFFLTCLLFLNFTTSDLKSSIFSVSDIEIMEPFEVDFKKTKVIDKAFLKAFKKLTKMTIASDQSQKLNNVKITEIKNLIESFNIRNERFIKNSYTANFEVNFNKQNTLLFYEKKNVFPSLPVNKDILVLPVLIDIQKKSIYLFDKNPFLNAWIQEKKNYHLLNYILPTEDLDLVKVLNNNSNNLEEYNYKNLIKKYGYDDFIICLIYKEKTKIKVFSRININNEVKIISEIFDIFEISNLKKINSFILNIQNSYEDVWKINNQINRSVKLAININVTTKEYQKNLMFENFLNSNELVSRFFIKSFDNKTINYKIIFNGSPKKFLEISKKSGISINTSNQVWLIN